MSSHDLNQRAFLGAGLDLFLLKLKLDASRIVVGDKAAAPYRINKEFRAAEIVGVNESAGTADNAEYNARTASIFRAILARRFPLSTRLRLGVT
jgi:hypothetical protein